MRIATNTLFDRGLAAINQAQNNMSHAQTELATGNRVNTAADDPIAASEILRTTSNLATNTQYISNQKASGQLLGQTDSTLGQVGDLLQSVRTTIVSANNGALGDSDRAALGVELKSRLDELVSLANTKNGDGHFLFGGFHNDTVPFTQTSAGIGYAGDDANRSLQVSASRQLVSTENGADLFVRIPAGNGVFTTAAAGTNTGNGTIDLGHVATPSALTGHGYDVRFSVASGVTTYQVVDTTTNQPVAAPAVSGNVYTSGNAITVDGAQITISGTPADTDHFTLAPAGKQSIFQTLQNVANLLATSGGGGQAGVARVSTGLVSALANVDNAMDHINAVRASVGVRQNELDALASSSASTDTDGQAQLSTLQDTDYAKASTELAKQQLALSAAQKTFAMIGNKTLFDYL